MCINLYIHIPIQFRVVTTLASSTQTLRLCIQFSVLYFFISSFLYFVFLFILLFPNFPADWMMTNTCGSVVAGAPNGPAAPPGGRQAASPVMRGLQLRDSSRSLVMNGGRPVNNNTSVWFRRFSHCSTTGGTLPSGRLRLAGKRTTPVLVPPAVCVPLRHGDCPRRDGVHVLRLFAEGPVHGGQVQGAACGAGGGQNSDGAGGGAAAVPHLARLRSGGVSGWVAEWVSLLFVTISAQIMEELLCLFVFAFERSPCSMQGWVRRRGIYASKHTRVLSRKWAERERKRREKVWFMSPPFCFIHAPDSHVLQLLQLMMLLQRGMLQLYFKWLVASNRNIHYLEFLSKVETL